MVDRFRPNAILCTIALAAVVALAGAALAHQAGSAANPPLDLFGDPLPNGALGRLGTIRFRQSDPHALAFAASGKVLVSAGQGFGVSLWDASTGRPLHQLSVPHSVWDLAVSPDGKSIFVLGAIPMIIDLTTGKEILRFDTAVAKGAFSPDGKTVAVGGNLGGVPTIIIWDIRTGKEIRRLKDEAAQFTAIAFSPDGKSAAWSSVDKTIRFWDTSSGNEIRRIDDPDIGDVALTYAPDGQSLAAIGSLGVVRLWDLASGKQRWNSKKQKALLGMVAFSPDSKLLAGAGREGTLYLWDAATGKEIRAWRASPSYLTLAFAPDGKTLASIGESDAVIRRWDAATGKEIGAVTGHSAGIWPVDIQPGGKALISRGGHNEILEWDLTAFHLRRELLTDSIGPTREGRFWRIAAHTTDGRIAALAWFPRQANNHDQSLTLWNCQTKKEIGLIKAQEPGVAFFTPDGKVLITVGPKVSSLWDTASGKELYQLKGEDGLAFRFNQPAFSPDSTRLAYFDAGARVRLMDIAKGKELLRWETPHDRSGAGAGWSIHFSPDGKTLATSDLRNTYLWNADTGQKLVQVGRQKQGSSASPVWSWAFSPSGRVLAGGGLEYRATNGDKTRTATIRLWDALSGQEIRQIDTPQGIVTAVAFTPDGRTLVSGGDDSTMLIWDLTGSATRASAKQPPLTAADLDKLWLDLGGDAAGADRALWALVYAPEQALAWLKSRMQPVLPAPDEQIAKLIADLDSAQFAVRQNAAKALDDLGESAEAGLRKAMSGQSPLEVRQRIEQSLKKRDQLAIAKLRAIEVLEQIGSPEARQVLEALAHDAPNPRVAEAAGKALTRLAK